jgi:hypothetical protein
MPLDWSDSSTAQQAGRMQHFVGDLLRHAGALVEPITPEGLEILVPGHVQEALGLGEFARLGFGATLPHQARRVGIEGDWLDRFARVLGSEGRRARLIYPGSNRAPGDPERILGHELLLDNATYRLLDVSPAWTRYLALDFRASAVSDDKRDFILRLPINLATGALPDAVLATVSPEHDAGFLEANDATPPRAAPPEGELPPMWERGRLLDLVERALRPRIDAALAPFIKALRRRLDRDQDRLHRYHNDLHREASQRAASFPTDDPRRLREEQRIAAIAREYSAKLDDLARQYATRVSVQWVQTLEWVVPVHRFTVQIRRRKSDRTILLDWNPVARKLDPPLCEATVSAERPRLVCDDALHLVVPQALGPCANCGKAFCRACHPSCCPKCETAKL